VSKAPKLEAPPLSTFDTLLQGSGEREMSTTMAFVRMLTALLRDKKLGKYVVPIVPDESRTFGMEGLFRQLGIYSSQGQLYEPVDSDTFAYYREEKTGQMLQEGICEAGGLSSWIAAGTSYANHGLPMLPFYIFYSMFGFQRVGDLIWAAGDSRTRGFLLGGTSGRTTLSGEGLQHQDGHSHLMAAAVPNCVAYDPTFAYEIVTILQDGMRRMLTEQEDVFYYVTEMNENYPQPAMPAEAREGILRGLYLFKQTEGAGERVQLLGSGSILREAIAAADLLRDDFGIAADVWSATSFTELARDGIATERWNLLHPVDAQRTAYVTQQLTGRRGPVIAATDYVRAVAEQIRPYVPGSYRVLGTDGFGRSDLRERLRRHFEVDRGFIATAALKALCDEGRVPPSTVRLALEKYGISAEKPQPAKS
jgi:pyruvate dehydrogenase E1 component